MDTELLTDDEALRIAGMTDGPKRKVGFTLSPLTALSLSWLQRNRIFDDGEGDMIQKTAAYAFVHTSKREEIRAVVNDRESFLDAVDNWIEKNIRHHSELEPVSQEMTDALDRYMAAITISANPSDPQPGGIKN